MSALAAYAVIILALIGLLALIVILYLALKDAVLSHDMRRKQRPPLEFPNKEKPS